MARRLDHPVDITHHGSTMNYGPRFDQLHRRELITLLGSATAACPLLSKATDELTVLDTLQN
jgi:hypothetical protein